MRKTIATDEYLQLVNWLREARLAQNMSMRDLAGKLDVPHSFIQRIEMLERRLDISEYCLYCYALGVNPVTGLQFFTSITNTP